VFQDADVDKAVEGALVCKFRSSGQTYGLFVHESRVEESTEKMIKRVQSFKLGRGIDEGVIHGPLINAASVEKIIIHVQDALEKGSRLCYGGIIPVDHPSGYFFEPTIITAARQDMLVANDETFGPLAAMFSFRSEDEVVSLANDTEFGLGGYFFSDYINRVLRVARQL